MALLITGGAGYIGSHTARMAVLGGHRVVVVDNLSMGHQSAAAGALFVKLDLRETDLLELLMREHHVSSIMHFAAASTVGESTRQALYYWQNNVEGTRSLLQAAASAGVDRLIFSSTCAIYGAPTQEKIDEKHSKLPVNCYGRTKLSCEWMIQDVARATGLKAVCLRFFNAAGASHDAALGERHDPETHLIPLALRAAATDSTLTVFGADYDTPDGTCIRDYVHVEDLAEAHLRALQHLSELTAGTVAHFNLGTGHGFSVREVLEAVESVTGACLKLKIGERRMGDPARLVADATLANRVLRWSPSRSSLRQLVQSAWNFAQTADKKGQMRLVKKPRLSASTTSPSLSQRLSPSRV